MIKILTSPDITLSRLKAQVHQKLQKQLDRIDSLWSELLQNAKPLENSKFIVSYILIKNMTQKFKVSSRTIIRDLDLLEIDGYIVEFDKNKQGEDNESRKSYRIIINISPQKKTLSSKQKATSLLQKFKNLSTLTI
jgi:hypothetical protein